MLVLEVQRKTIFAKLNDVFPECSFLIQGQDQLYPLFCIKNEYCPRNMNCMDRLVRRCKHMFDAFPDAQLLILYFAYQDRPGSHRAGVFWRDLREPRFITFNRSSWVKMKEIGTVFEYTIPDTVFLQTGT